MNLCSNCGHTLQPDDDVVPATRKRAAHHRDEELCRLLLQDTEIGAYETPSYGPRVPPRHTLV